MSIRTLFASQQVEYLLPSISAVNFGSTLVAQGTTPPALGVSLFPVESVPIPYTASVGTPTTGFFVQYVLSAGMVTVSLVGNPTTPADSLWQVNAPESIDEESFTLTPTVGGSVPAEFLPAADTVMSPAATYVMCSTAAASVTAVPTIDTTGTITMPLPGGVTATRNYSLAGGHGTGYSCSVYLGTYPAA